MKKLVLGFTFLIAIFCAFAFNAQADTIFGFTSFSGTLNTDGTSLADATTITSFTDVTVATLGGLVDYDPIPGGSPVVLSSPFVFNPSTPISDFWVIDFAGVQYSYNVLSSQIDLQNANQLNLQGTGIASITGFEDTDSIWFLSVTSGGNTSTFTLSTLVPPEFVPPSNVPEPATMLLLGMGLLGVAGLGRKKK